MKDEHLAECIRKLSSALDRALKSGLNKDAIIILLHHKTKVSRKSIKAVLDSLQTLEKDYCNVDQK